VVLTAPELVEPELVDVLGKLDVAPDLERGVLADGVMRSEEDAEAKTGHVVVSP
jgi:hypothetical protein